MKKSTVALLIVMTIILSGAAGFGGAYLSGAFTALPAVPHEVASSPGPTGAHGFDVGQIYAYIDDYLSSSNEGEASPNDVSFLSNVNETATRKQLTIPEIAALASKSVVEIYTESAANSGRLRQFITEGAGSGVIISGDGHIVTNNHVIEGSSRITVRLNTGKDYEAVLVGRDSKTDIAVVKIDATGLQPALYGNSDNLVVGELAVAIGNPLGKLGGSVTEGIISAHSRNIEIDGNMMTLLQTTAAVNPGNSGGGLFNCFGELIGVVNAKSSGSDIEGIGFAIPINLARYNAESLIQYGYIPGRIDFGATLVNVLDPITAMMYRVQSTGVYVSYADADSQLQSGDRIISINGKDIRSIADVKEIIDNHKVGDSLPVVVSRGGRAISVEHTLTLMHHTINLSLHSVNIQINTNLLYR